jgi:hypothetical protein
VKIQSNSSLQRLRRLGFVSFSTPICVFSWFSFFIFEFVSLYTEGVASRNSS